MIQKIDAIVSLVPGAQVTVIDNGVVEWVSPSIAPVTDEQIQQEFDRLVAQQPFDECKTTAKQLIAATDWSVLPDVGLQNKSEFEAYRAQLRALIVTPVSNPVWPIEPSPVWS